MAAGGGDQAAQAVGVGAVEPGIVGLTVGTSGVVFATTPSAMIEPEGRLHAFCHAVPGMWHFMGVMLSAAGSLQWYRDTLAPHASFDELMESAAEVPAGSEGLQFLPYLCGERTPYPDPLARGAFIGLTIRHTQAHMTRSVLEGVSFGLKDMFTLIQNAGLKEITQVRASGGGTKSALLAGRPGLGAGLRAGDGQYRGRGCLRRSLAGRGGLGDLAGCRHGLPGDYQDHRKDGPDPAGWKCTEIVCDLPGPLPGTQGRICAYVLIGESKKPLIGGRRNAIRLF